MAGIDYFLNIDGIEGESADSRHPGEIEVISLAWGVATAAGSGARGSAGAGRAEADEFIVVKPVDRSTPRLMVACATGEHFPDAVLSARRAGGDDFLTYTLTDVVVARYATEGDEAEELPLLDEVGLRFSVIEIAYRRQRGDGSLEAPVSHGYDFRRNRST